MDRIKRAGLYGLVASASLVLGYNDYNDYLWIRENPNMVQNPELWRTATKWGSVLEYALAGYCGFAGLATIFGKTEEETDNASG